MVVGMKNSDSGTPVSAFPALDVSAFGAYDVRGVIGETVTAGLYYRAARAAAEVLGAQAACVGFDARETSANFALAALRGLTEAGCQTLTLGLCGTEEVYFAAGSQNLGLGLMVTASHNPLDYNGLKLVGPGAQPLTDAEFTAIKELTASGDFAAPDAVGASEPAGDTQREAYAAHLAGLTLPTEMGAHRILFDCGSGAAGPTLEAVLAELNRRGAEIDAVIDRGTPDPTFPDGVPNPLLPEMRAATARAVAKAGADFGVAFDGDFDRCFLFDAAGTFVQGEYVVALLARAALAQNPGQPIVHDPRATGAIRAAVIGAGGVPALSKTGHAYVKDALRATSGPYGGEMSGHNYFRDFFNCDSGMLPWMLIAQQLQQSGQTLADTVAEMRAKFPSSGEINFRVADKGAAVTAVRGIFEPDAVSVNRTDGLSCDFRDWRFNLRASNTENLLRLNVEATGSRALVEARTADLSAILNKWAAQ
jgi:phosphomannomutase